MPGNEVEKPIEAKPTRINATYELFIIFLSVYTIAVLFLAVIFPIKESTAEILKLVDSFVVIVFIYDFFRQLYMAPKKLDYLKWGWMDLLSAVPGIYYLRLFRISRIIRASSQLRKETGRSVWEAFKENRANSAVLTSVISLFVLIVVTSILILGAESQSPAAEIHSPEDAVWWSFVTLTTVGYGDEVPTTTEGRFIGFVLMAGGVILLAVFTGYAASYFNPQSDREEEMLTEIRQEMAEIKNMLREYQQRE